MNTRKVLLLLPVAIGLIAQSNDAPAPAPTGVAAAMVAAADRTPRLAGAAGAMFGGEIGKNWTKEQNKQVFASLGRMLEAAQATTSEKLDGMNLFQMLVTAQKWVDTGMGPAFQPELLALWEARVKRIDLVTARAWAANSQRLALEQGTPSTPKVLLFLAFQDHLFNGQEWKPGQPQQATRRLASFPDKSQLAQWAQITGQQPTWGSAALVPVDELFVNDAFQPARFQTAFPIAAKILAARKAGNP